MKSFLTVVVFASLAWLGLTALDTATRPLASASSSHGVPHGFVSNYQAALARAKTENKPVVLIFSAGWCPPCQHMRKEVYPSREVVAYSSDFVWAYLDVDEPSATESARKFDVRGIPHIQFLTATGEPIGKVIGSRSPTEFAEELKFALAKSSKDVAALH